MYVHDEKKLIFLAHPRTASRAVAIALCDQAGFERRWAHHDGVKRKFDHLYEDYEKVTFVRNHFDALVSWWFHMGRRIPLSHRFVEGGLLHRPWFPLEGQWWGLHAPDADKVLKYEEGVDKQLNGWLFEHDLGPVVLGRRGGSHRTGVPWELFVDIETHTWMADTYGDEMKRYGYLDPMASNQSVVAPVVGAGLSVYG